MKTLRLGCLLVMITVISGHAQLPGLNRLKNRAAGSAEQKAGDEIDKLFGGKKKSNDPNNPNGGTGANPNAGSPGSGGTNNPGNNSGGGLISTPPGVLQNLTDADAAYKRNAWGEARYAVQQAMLGVELEIGNKILNSLPENVGTLKRDASADQVASMGFGWAGLTIHREWNGGKDQELRVTVANNSAWMSAVNVYLSSGGYAQQTGGQQNWKQTKIKGYRAIIEYDQSSGYKLSVPLGQSSLIVYEGVNFSTEPDFMTACNAIDIEGIKKQLGEQ
ncbi:MAG: hypothetical protein ACK5V5_14155 [Cyclobacteriaceae bacterium]|jgi:hypothetical protein|nr:hypothetical protein [Flammeovirgaceae bacterium]